VSKLGKDCRQASWVEEPRLSSVICHPKAETRLWAGQQLGILLQSQHLLMGTEKIKAGHCGHNYHLTLSVLISLQSVAEGGQSMRWILHLSLTLWLALQATLGKTLKPS
jgi:hypothetical protein